MPRKYYCTYLEQTQQLTREMPTANASQLTISHDPWCPILGGDGKRPCKPHFFLNGIPVEPPPPDTDLPPASGSTLLLSDHDADGVVYDNWKTETIEANTELVGTVGGRKLKLSSEDPKPGEAACMYCWQVDRKMVKATHIVEYAGLPSVVMCEGCASDVQQEIDAGASPAGCSVRPLRD